MVPQAGLEPAHLAVVDFESTASTISPLGHLFLGIPWPEIRLHLSKRCHRAALLGRRDGVNYTIQFKKQAPLSQMVQV